MQTQNIIEFYKSPWGASRYWEPNNVCWDIMYYLPSKHKCIVIHLSIIIGLVLLSEYLTQYIIVSEILSELWVCISIVQLENLIRNSPEKRDQFSQWFPSKTIAKSLRSKLFSLLIMCIAEIISSKITFAITRRKNIFQNTIWKKKTSLSLRWTIVTVFFYLCYNHLYSKHIRFWRRYCLSNPFRP